ncbi:class I SAM-dependent rRNA methyltransferase [Thalassoglobus polymorphus]|uniref:Ribosomal RNA large subunit methyltransferase I n=1 Tax=Thalassoglobus polymorphus TaxID=2527994 RepID=A0A517QKK6_9PLAN|nr:class I SAM-dependent rRNA methyltransferase [Thalassoglobus polymorphus]QDT32178.1 Ribosomal RNA large subunit methyltransferase I [Thalassoglobus polymorphus]
MPPYQPRRNKSSQQKKTKRTPYMGKARKESRLPLDDKFLVQRPFLRNDISSIPVARLKTTTKHPTVFRKRIANVADQSAHGDVVQVRADSGETVGYGFWNPRAEATIRMLSWGEVLPDERWWEAQIKQAVSLRKDLLQLKSRTNAYRLINAEGDGFPGLVVDLYSDVITVQTYTLGMYQRGEAIARMIAKILDTKHWVVRTGPATFPQEGFLADGFESGKVPEKLMITEQGAKYEIHPFEGHKTGFFCDQRENRIQLRDYCKGKDVLDLCCYSGGFSINAALGGAKKVTGVDLDEEAIEFAKRNANLNKSKVKFVHADAFAYMRDMQRNNKLYDVIILDPPKLIRGRDEMHEGQNKYFDFNQLAASLVKPGGLLLSCSCSGLLSMSDFTMTVRAAITERTPRILARSGAGPDHPVQANCLETEYLKCLWMQL